MGGGNLDPVPLIRILKGPRMLNKYLTAICKAERIPCAGAVKAIMQQRIQDSKLVSHSFRNNTALHLYTPPFSLQPRIRIQLTLPPPDIEKYVAEGNVVKFNNLKALLSNPDDALYQNGSGYAPYSSSPAAPSPRPAPGIQAPRYMANGLGSQPGW